MSPLNLRRHVPSFIERQRPDRELDGPSVSGVVIAVLLAINLFALTMWMVAR